MKVTLSEIKNSPQETNREGKEAGIQTNDLEHKRYTFNQDKKKKQEFRKMRIGRGTSETSPNMPISES